MVVDARGTHGRRSLPGAVCRKARRCIALAAPGVSFLLVEDGTSAASAVADRRADRRRGDRCLVSRPAVLPGLGSRRCRGSADGRAGESRHAATGAAVTAREVVWLQAETADPALRRNRRPRNRRRRCRCWCWPIRSRPRLTDDGEVRAVTSASLLAGAHTRRAGGAVGGAARRASPRSLIKDDAAVERRAATTGRRRTRPRSRRPCSVWATSQPCARRHRRRGDLGRTTRWSRPLTVIAEH